jgi:hypothetical protein
MTNQQREEERFCVFKQAKWGIRAIARTIITYQDKRKAKDGSAIDTVQEIIDRWAPPIENDTDAYANYVRSKLYVERGEVVDVHSYKHMMPLVKAIVMHENGEQPQGQIDAGLVLAGVIPPEKPLHESRTIKGGTVASAGITAAGAIETAQLMIGNVQELVPYLEEGKWVSGVLVICGISTMIWARIDDKRKGLR